MIIAVLWLLMERNGNKIKIIINSGYVVTKIPSIDNIHTALTYNK